MKIIYFLLLLFGSIHSADSIMKQTCPKTKTHGEITCQFNLLQNELTLTEKNKTFTFTYDPSNRMAALKLKDQQQYYCDKKAVYTLLDQTSSTLKVEHLISTPPDPARDSSLRKVFTHIAKLANAINQKHSENSLVRNFVAKCFPIESPPEYDPGIPPKYEPSNYIINSESEA